MVWIKARVVGKSLVNFEKGDYEIKKIILIFKYGVIINFIFVLIFKIYIQI